MANNVRFVDSIKVGAYGTGGGSSISSSYALTSSYSSYAVSASYAISASHEIIKEVSSSHADTASFAQSGDGIFSGSFSGSFQGDGSGLTGLSTDTNIDKVYYVSPSGSDSTGTMGDWHKPFLTISGSVQQAVINASSSGYSTTGSLIYINPGHYFEQALSYNGNFYFEPGATLSPPIQLSANRKPIFEAGSNGIDRINIFGNGEFIVPPTTDADQNSTLVSAVGTGSIYFECYKTKLDYSYGAYGADTGSIIIRGKEWVSKGIGGTLALMSGHASCIATFDNIDFEATGLYAAAVTLRNQSGQPYFGTTTVNANNMVIKNRTGFIAQTMGEGSRLKIDVNNLVISQSAIGIVSLFGAGNHKIEVNANITTYGKPFYQSYGGIGDPGLQYIQTGVHQGYGSHIFESDLACTDEEFTLDVWAEVSGSDYGILHEGGTLFLNRSLYNTKIDGDGIRMVGGTLKFDNHKIITSGSGYSISGSGAHDAYINNILSSNVSASSNITLTGPGIYTSDQTGQIINTNLSSSATSTASFGTYIGDGSQLTGIVSASYALTASYAFSASHEIIKEVSSSYADTASFAQSGDGIFSGSFSGSFQGDGSGLIGLSTGTDIAVTYFISPSGSDSTGTVGDLHKPFKTITAAVDQAVIDALTNPLIYVFPGTYTDASIQFEGGTFFFTSGVSLTGPPQYHGTTGLTGVNQGTKTFTTPGNFASHFNIPGKKIKILGSANLGIYTVVSAADNGPDTDVVVSEAIPSATFASDRLTDAIALFEVGTPASSNPIIYGHNSDNIKVYGEVSTNIPATIDGDWSGGFCNAYSGSNAYLEIHDITVEQAVGVSTWSDAILTLKGEYFNVTDKGYAALVQDESDTVFNFQRIISSGSYSFFYRTGDSSTYTGTSRVELEELQGVGSSTSGFTFYKVDTGSRIFVECTDIYMGAGASYGISNFFHSGGDIKVTGNITSPLGLMNYYGTGGNLRFNGNLIVSSNPTLPFVWIGSSNTYINGDIYHNDTPTIISEGIKIDGGTLRLNGKIQNDTVGGLGINKTGGTLLIDNSRLITDSYSISSSVAQDVFINNSLSTNTSASSDITFIGPGIYTSDQTGQIINTNLSSSATSTSSFGTYIGDGSQLTGIVSSSYALTASYAVSASHEIIKEISSSHADTASFAQSGNGIFSGSFSGSFEGDGSGLMGLEPFPFTGDAVITGSLLVSGSSGVDIEANQSISVGNQFKAGNAFLNNDTGVTSQLHLGLGISSAALITTQRHLLKFVRGTNSSGGGGSSLLVLGTMRDGGAEMNEDEFFTAGDNLQLYFQRLNPEDNYFGYITRQSVGYFSTTAHRAIGPHDIINPNGTTDAGAGNVIYFTSGSNYYKGITLSNEGEVNIPSGSISASYFVGDGSQLTNLPLVTSASYALTSSYSHYAVSASHEIIKEVSSSYADTASFAQSGNGIFSGSFSGSYVGDGSGLTGVDPFPFSGSAVITGSLVISGIGATPSLFYTAATINSTAAATSESIYSLSTSSYDGVFFDYTVSSASNARAGNIMSVWNGGNLVYTENTTTDIGSTSGVVFNVEISQSQAQLISVTDTAGWKIKTTIKSI